MQDLRGGGHAFFEVSVSEHFARALLTLFQTISGKIALRNARSVCEISHSIPAVVLPYRDVVNPLSSSPLTVSTTFF